MSLTPIKGGPVGVRYSQEGLAQSTMNLSGSMEKGSTSFLQRGKLFPKGDSISCIDEAEKSRTEKLTIQFGT